MRVSGTLQIPSPQTVVTVHTPATSDCPVGQLLQAGGLVAPFTQLATQEPETKGWIQGSVSAVCVTGSCIHRVSCGTVVTGWGVGGTVGTRGYCYRNGSNG